MAEVMDGDDMMRLIAEPDFSFRVEDFERLAYLGAGPGLMERRLNTQWSSAVLGDGESFVTGAYDYESYVLHGFVTPSVCGIKEIVGGGGIRTHEGPRPLLEWKSSAISHSATPPDEAPVEAGLFH